MVPTLKTNRLSLRPLELADAPRMAALLNAAPEIARMTSSMLSIQPAIGAEGYILIAQARAPLKREHMFAVDLPGAGFIGGATVDVVGDQVGAAHAEIGYWLGKPFWGVGYGTEVARAATAYALALGVGAVVAHHFADNPASGRVLEKTGFAYTGEVRALFSLSRAQSVPARLMAYRADARAAA